MRRPKRLKVSFCVFPNDAKSHSALSQMTQSLTLRCPKRRKISLCVVPNDAKSRSAPSQTTQSLTLRRPKQRKVSHSASSHATQSLTLRRPKWRKVSLYVSPADAIKSKGNIFCNKINVFVTFFSPKNPNHFGRVPFDQLPPFSSPSSGLKTRLANTMRR